jgi:hypothetical protein
MRYLINVKGVNSNQSLAQFPLTIGTKKRRAVKEFKRLREHFARNYAANVSLDQITIPRMETIIR